MSHVLHVDINGQRYAIRSDLDAQYVSELAAYLDEKMRQAARELASAEPLRIAVIAALNIADELRRARADARGLEGRMHARAEEIEHLLDEALGRASARIVVNE